MLLNKKIIDEIGEILKYKNEKISVVESVTAGSLQFYLSQMNNASLIFSGGITVYDANHKIKLLRVREEDTKVDNCVSQNITEQITKNLFNLFDVDWTIGTTGYATAIAESDFKLFAFYCIGFRGGIQDHGKIEIDSTIKPLEAQFQYASIILQKFLESIKA